MGAPVRSLLTAPKACPHPAPEICPARRPAPQPALLTRAFRTSRGIQELSIFFLRSQRVKINRPVCDLRPPVPLSRLRLPASARQHTSPQAGKMRAVPFRRAGRGLSAPLGAPAERAARPLFSCFIILHVSIRSEPVGLLLLRPARCWHWGQRGGRSTARPREPSRPRPGLWGTAKLDAPGKQCRTNQVVSIPSGHTARRAESRDLNRYLHGLVPHSIIHRVTMLPLESGNNPSAPRQMNASPKYGLGTPRKTIPP